MNKFVDTFCYTLPARQKGRQEVPGYMGYHRPPILLGPVKSIRHALASDLKQAHLMPVFFFLWQNRLILFQHIIRQSLEEL